MLFLSSVKGTVRLRCSDDNSVRMKPFRKRSFSHPTGRKPIHDDNDLGLWRVQVMTVHRHKQR